MIEGLKVLICDMSIIRAEVDCVVVVVVDYYYYYYYADFNVVFSIYSCVCFII